MAGDVGGDEGLSLACRRDKGAAQPGGVHLAGAVREEDRKGVGALEDGLRLGDRGDGVPVVEGIDELRGDLGVGAREEIIPLAEQPGTQLLIVFDDAVMHQRELFGGVGVGVYVGGLPVGGPAGVPDAAAARQPGMLCLQPVGQVLQAALRLDGDDAVPVKDRDAGGVVAAVFQPRKGIKKDADGSFAAGVTNNSAHRYLSFPRGNPFCKGPRPRRAMRPGAR